MYNSEPKQRRRLQESKKLFTLACALLTISGCRGFGSPSAASPQRIRATAQPVSTLALPNAYTTFTATNFVVHLHRPAAGALKNAPAVVLIGGSGGGIGWQDYMAERLAQRGIIGVALAYFAYDSLPKELDRIPLEAFDEALKLVNAQPGVDRARLAIAGVSKGAEAALLVASTHSELKAIAVFSPSAYVFQSVTRDFRNTSSWTRKGVNVPYIPYGDAPAGSALVEFYQRGVRDATPALREAARIAVERIRMPLLMLSGDNDTLWGSGQFANEIAAQLTALKRDAFENIVYKDAGHLISSIRDDDVTNRGGTKEGNQAAQVDGQRRFLEFFERRLMTR